MKSLSERVKKDTWAFLWPHWRKDFRDPLVIDRAEGALFWDINGREYIDGVSGVYVVNIGYGNREVLDAMKAQMERLTYTFLAYASSPVASEVARSLVELSPGRMAKVYFTNSGGESVETAVKMARLYHVARGDRGRYRVISRWVSFHGSTLGALSCTGHPPRRRFFEPLLLDFPHIQPPYCYRCPFGEKYPECEVACAQDLEATIKKEGAETISAFIAEPMVGLTAGTLVPVPEYYKIIREICDKYGILFIADEVITGFGRTGKNFGCEHYGVEPDLMTVAKGLTCGYAPLGAVVVSGGVAETLGREDAPIFQHGYTFAGNPVACAAASECMEILVRDRLAERASKMGEYLLGKLRNLDHKIIGDVRGKGLLTAIELVRDKESKEVFGMDEQVGAMVEAKALSKGVKIFGTKGFNTGMIGDLLSIAPPLIVSYEQIDRIVDTIDEAMGEVEETLS